MTGKYNYNHDNIGLISDKYELSVWGLETKEEKGLLNPSTVLCWKIHKLKINQTWLFYASRK